MKLLLDEMISPRIARELRSAGHDVEAIKADRPDLEAAPDRKILARMATEQRGIVTNDVLDFQLLHEQLVSAGEAHGGIVFTDDVSFPRNKASIPLWVETLGSFLTENPADDALRNRVHYLL